MLHKEIVGLTILAFLLWIVFAADPSERISRSCRPVAWVGNAATSVAALTSPVNQRGVDKWFKGLDYGCRYTVWRMIYQEEYAAWEQSQQTHGGDTAAEPKSTDETVQPAHPAKKAVPAGDGL